MSRRPAHLMCRGGVYWVRLRVPTRLGVRLGRGEVRRSLRTCHRETAAIRAAVAVAWLKQLCVLLFSMPDLTTSDIDALILRFFKRLTENHLIPTVPKGHDLEIWQDEAAEMYSEMINGLQDSLLMGETPGLVLTNLKIAMKAEGVSLEELPAQARLRLEQGAIRATQEQYRYNRAMILDPGGSYQPTDLLFKGALNASATPPKAGGPKLASAVAEYLEEHKGEWAAKTHAENARVLGWVQDAFGKERPLASISKSDLSSLRSKFLGLRKRASSGSLESRIAHDDEARIAPKTASKYFGFVTAFLNWAANERGVIEVSPASGVTIKFKKDKKSGAAKSATDKAVRAFFETPLFQGHHAQKRHLPGVTVSRDGYYWLFVVQLTTGMRVGEVAQLLCADVDMSAEVPVLHVRHTDEFGATDDVAKSIKTDSSVRRVPIPASLVKLGFAAFVERRKKTGPRLFSEFASEANRSPSDRATKFAQRYLERVGQKQQGKATHWLRHAWTDAMRNCGAPPYVISLVDGHKLPGMADVYGTGENLNACKEWIDKANFGFDVVEVLTRSKARWSA